MRFMSLWRPGPNANPPTEKMVLEMNTLIGEMSKAGVMIQNGGWSPASPCTILKSASGKVTVTDGPYTEAKELIAGFAILEVQSKAEAIEWGTFFLKIAGDGTSEMRQLGEGQPQ
jgi:hypothetical protein